jgi:ribonuclease D
MLSELEGFEEVAVDTEADSFYHYQERVCLIQITAGERDWLVDPLRGYDISGLGALLADPARVKVFHDGEYDILILKRQYGFSFAQLFDTRVAVAALGIEAQGLAAVLHERFGVELDKSLQRSNWSRRPLTRKQIAYARLDTHYLVPLMRELRDELESKGRTMIVEGECQRLQALEPPPREFNPDEFIRLRGARTLNPDQKQRLRELYVMRDSLARERDLPPFKIIGNAELMRLARGGARTKRGLRAIEGVSPKIVQRLGTPIMEALRRAEEAGPLARLPRLPSRDGTGPLDDLQVELHDRLKQWRKQRAVSDGMDSSLVLNRLTLLELATHRPTTLAELREVDGVQAWQIELYGTEILAVVERLESDHQAGKLKARRRRR